MKIICIFLLSLMGLNVLAQSKDKTNNKIEFISGAVSSGQGPLSSGVFLEANFLVNNRNILNVSIGERDMYILYLKSFSKNRLMVGGSLEYYYNVPTTGILIKSEPITGDFSLSTMTWTGISAGTPGDKAKLLNWRYLFFWQSATATYKRFSLTGAVLNYDYVWGHLFDFKYTQPLNKHFSLFSSGGYNFFQDGNALFKIGLIYKL